jgi:hypothetical protein
MADRNGDGIVYHRSDCGDNYVRWYGFGGDGPCSSCDTWGLSNKAIRYIHDHPEINHRCEDMMAEWFNDNFVEPINNIVVPEIMKGYEVVKDGAITAYKWADENACNIAITAAISAGVVAAFTPAQPAGAATSTTLSFMAAPVLYTTDLVAKSVVATAMGEIIARGFLQIPGVGDSVDEQLLKNVISNCVMRSLDSAALWGTPAGVGIAIGAAVAPVIADLICTRTCPEGFSKALTT